LLEVSLSSIKKPNVDPKITAKFTHKFIVITNIITIIFEIE